MEKQFTLPFASDKEFVEWAKAALARKKAVTDKAQRDRDEYVAKRMTPSCGAF